MRTNDHAAGRGLDRWADLPEAKEMVLAGESRSSEFKL
jgi:hypothetical protein